MRTIKKKESDHCNVKIRHTCANPITLHREIYGNRVALASNRDTYATALRTCSTENLTINISFLTTFMRGGTSFSTYASSITQCCKIFFKNKYPLYLDRYFCV